MKPNKNVQFLTVVLLMGALLSVTVYVVLGVALRREDVDFRQNADELFVNRWFYGEKRLNAFRDAVDYRLFRHIDDESIIVGREDWLFATGREDSDYDYLLDYVGGCAYSEKQMASVARTLTERQRLCREAGGEYRLVVIPNAMTVCDEYLPSYLGEPSENTRLSLLSAYLKEAGVDCVVDLRDAMEEMRNTGKDPYHNTEDAINAYGAFVLYDAVLSELGQTEGRFAWEDVSFSTRVTEGRSLAEKNGLERTIRNRTVSLTETMTDGYSTEETTEFCVSTTMSEAGVDRTVVLECSEEWDRIQLMPFFSGTFQMAVYENRLTQGTETMAYHHGSVLIQVIHESQLDLLLP